MRLIPGSGRSPGEGNGNPLQFSCLENSMDRGVWRTIVHWAAKELDMNEHACMPEFIAMPLFSMEMEISPSDGL